MTEIAEYATEIVGPRQDLRVRRALRREPDARPVSRLRATRDRDGVVLPLPAGGGRRAASRIARCASGRTPPAATSTAHTVQTLLRDGKTGVMDGFTARSGRTYRAHIEIDREAWQVKVRSAGWDEGGTAVDVPEYEVNPEPLGRCPFEEECSVVESPTQFVCERALKDEDAGKDESRPKSCGFVFPRTVCKREITREEAVVYVATGKTELLTDFTSRFGRPFSATLVLKKTGRHGFEFQPRGRAQKGAEGGAEAAPADAKPAAAAKPAPRRRGARKPSPLTAKVVRKNKKPARKPARAPRAYAPRVRPRSPARSVDATRRARGSPAPLRPLPRPAARSSPRWGTSISPVPPLVAPTGRAPPENRCFRVLSGAITARVGTGARGSPADARPDLCVPPRAASTPVSFVGKVALDGTRRRLRRCRRCHGRRFDSAGGSVSAGVGVACSHRRRLREPSRRSTAASSSTASSKSSCARSAAASTKKSTSRSGTTFSTSSSSSTSRPTASGRSTCSRATSASRAATTASTRAVAACCAPSTPTAIARGGCRSACATPGIRNTAA